MEVKAKRQRVVGVKYSKNACRTCRIRRVKCDEDRPNCRNCVSTGRTCDGYNIAANGSHIVASKRPLLPTPSYSTTITISPPLSCMTFNTNVEDARSFRYFLENIVQGLTHISPHEDWTNLALQLSSNEPAIFYAMAAIGSVAKNRLAENGYTFYTPPTQVTSNLALKQYCKATALLQKYIDHAILQQASIEPVVLCCLLFVTYQVYQGDTSLAIAHLRLGRRVIEGSNSSLTSGKVQKTPLKPSSATLTWLASESLHFDQDMGVLADSKEGNEVPRPSNILSTHFVSTAHAKQTLDNLVTAGLNWRADLLKLAEEHIAGTEFGNYRYALRVCIVACLSRSLELPPGHYLLIQRSTLIQSHEAWLSAIATLPSSRDLSATLLMQIQLFASFIILQESRETTNTPMDGLKSRFSNALDLVETYLSARRLGPKPPRVRNQKTFDPYSPLPQNQEDSFSLEYAILPTLFMACLKCRCHDIRHRALGLLRTANRREGFQYSGELVHYADSIVALEEASASADTSGRIPEEARVLEVTIESVGFLNLNLLCGRYRHEEDGKLEITEYRGAGLPPLRLRVLEKHILPFRG